MSSILQSRSLSTCFIFIIFTTLTISRRAIPSNALPHPLTQDSTTLQLSQAANLSLPISDSFPIPNTDLALRFYQIGSLLNSADLNSVFLEAGSHIQHEIDQRGVNAASPERWHEYKSDDGMMLEIWSRSFSSEGIVGLGELRKVIDGLSLYMIQGRRSRAVRFQVIQNLGATKAVIMNIGSIRKDAALPTASAKREVPASPWTQYPSISTVISPVNVSTMSLQTEDDFPIPNTDYTLRFGNLGDRLHPWDLETLLIAVSAAIEEEIADHGRNARLSSTEYSRNLAGLQFWIQSMPWDTVNLAWAELAIIVHGLWLYIVDERHDREAFLDVINDLTGRQVALAWIGKSHRSLEATSLT